LNDKCQSLYPNVILAIPRVAQWKVSDGAGQRSYYARLTPTAPFEVSEELTNQYTRGNTGVKNG